jgi:transcriptional regulator with XRE-family HTH domain
MRSQTITFGRAIASKRKEIMLSQKELAARILKEDGEPITPQYLNDIEHDRRNPSSDHIVQQFAEQLNLPSDYLYYLAGRIPADVLGKKLSPQDVSKFMTAFRRSVTGK